MIEIWIALFIYILVRNKFIQYFLEGNGIHKYKQYDIKKIFNHWSIIPSLLMLLFYIYLEYTMFIKFYYFLQYQHIIKIIMLLSYFPLIIKNKLYENDNEKYNNKPILSIFTSPMSISTLCILIGSGLNKLATYCNNGKMPTYPTISYWTKYIDDSGFIDGIHVLGTSHSSAIIFCNIFDLGGYGVISIGDLFIRMYVFIILYYSIKIKNKSDERRK